MSKFLSRKFVLTVLAFLVVLFNEALKLEIPKETIGTLFALVIGYNVVEGTRDVAGTLMNGNK